MNFKKIITNTLALVGAVVIIDKIVDVVKDKSTKCICDKLNSDDLDNEDYDTDHSCGCSCSDSEEDATSCECSEDCSCKENSSDIHDDKKYNQDDKHAFEYTVKSENITSKPTQA